MRASRRGHGADVILARGSQYSTRRASASYTFSKKLQFRKKKKKKLHDFFVKRAVDFVLDLLLHSLRAPATNARGFFGCFQACILPPNFLTGSLRPGKLHRCAQPAAHCVKTRDVMCAHGRRRSGAERNGLG